MTDQFDDIKIYLPKFLSPEREKDLFKCLKDFPNNINSKFHSPEPLNSDELYQADGVDELLVFDDDGKTKPSQCMIISNSCDMDLTNSRIMSKRICYSPILSLNRFIEKLKSSNYEISQINSVVDDIQSQKISNVFFIPRSEQLKEDSIIFLDRIYHCKNSLDLYKILSTRKVFSLSNYGYYIFLLKLSIHFTRIRDGIDRG